MKLIYNKRNYNHLKELTNLANKSDKLIIISPFLGENIENILSKINESGKLKIIELISVLETFNQRNNNPIQFQSFIKYCEDKSISYKIKINEHSHGKTYIFFNKNKLVGTLITSANFTQSGLQNQQEFGLLTAETNIQNELIKLLQIDELSELSKTEINELVNTSEPNKIDKKNIVSNKYKPVIIDPNSITKGILKPNGSSNNYFEFKENLMDPNNTWQFFNAKKIKRHFDEQGIIVGYGINHPHPIIGIYKLKSTQLKKDMRNNSNPRWPVYMESINLFPDYTDKAYKKGEGLSIEYCYKQFNIKYPSNPISPKGGIKLPVNGRNDYYYINLKFLQFILFEMKLWVETP